MGWIVVPNLLECRDQMNSRFPNRSKGSDGTIGDTAHQASPSSHNPDLTGSPEYRDGDSKDEVRALDLTTALNDSRGATMEQVIQLWITKARSGSMPWLRYVIYNRRIWHKSDGFVSHTYTGSDPHTGHSHINSDFTNYADTVTGTNWHLSELGGGLSTPSKPPSSSGLSVDGMMGPKTISRWQQVMGTPIDGVISRPSILVKAVQRKLKAIVDSSLVIDGDGIRQDNKFYHTTKALQVYLGTTQDGRMSTPVSEVVKALQRRLNSGGF